MKRFFEQVVISCLVVILIASVVNCITSANPPVDSVDQEVLVASDSVPDNRFGIAMAYDAERLVIAATAAAWEGESKETTGLTPRGAVYLFTRPADGQWLQDAKVAGRPSTAGWDFARSVDMAGSDLVIGCPICSVDGVQTGQAFTYRFDGKSWAEETSLGPSDAKDGEWGRSGAQFGDAVAVDGDILVVGARLDNPSGSVYVFRRDGTRWSETQKLTPDESDPRCQFGSALALQGNRLVVGAWQSDESGKDSGIVYVFRNDGTRWVKEAKLSPKDPQVARHFGWSVGIDGASIVVGANRTDVLPSEHGAAYIFTLLSEKRWVQEAELRSPLTEPYDFFGGAVDIDGDWIVVGAANSGHEDDRINGPGAAFLFGRGPDQQWQHVATLRAAKPAARAGFGHQVALGDGRVFVSGIGHRRSFTRGRDTSGSVLVFPLPR